MREAKKNRLMILFDLWSSALPNRGSAMIYMQIRNWFISMQKKQRWDSRNLIFHCNIRQKSKIKINIMQSVCVWTRESDKHPN